MTASKSTCTSNVGESSEISLEFYQVHLDYGTNPPFFFLVIPMLIDVAMQARHINFLLCLLTWFTGH